MKLKKITTVIYTKHQSLFLFKMNNRYYMVDSVYTENNNVRYVITLYILCIQENLILLLRVMNVLQQHQRPSHTKKKKKNCIKWTSHLSSSFSCSSLTSCAAVTSFIFILFNNLVAINVVTI